MTSNLWKEKKSKDDSVIELSPGHCSNYSVWIFWGPNMLEGEVWFGFNLLWHKNGGQMQTASCSSLFSNCSQNEMFSDVV